MNQNEKESPKTPGEEEYERAIYLVNSGHLKEAMSLLYTSANLNYPPSFLWLHCFLRDEDDQNKWNSKAAPNFPWYQSKAQDEKLDSLFNLGYCLHYGIGTDIDLDEAVELYTIAAEEGFASAQFQLGVCFQKGKGVTKDINRAIELFTKAAEQGHARAQLNLGACYKDGRVAPTDINRAVELFNKSAEQGYASAQYIQFSSENLDVQAIADAFKVDRAITFLNLNHSNIRDSGAQAIANVLKINKTITSLLLHYNKIGFLGAQAIADALRVNHTLTFLNVSYNQFGDKGAQAIADALKVNNTLDALNLFRNEVGDLGAQAIADALKVNNTLAYNLIGNLGVQAIANALKIDKFRVKGIELTNTSIENIEEALKIKKVLHRLDLSNNLIEDEGMNAIAEMLKVNNSLQELHIIDNNFTDISKLGDALKYNRSLTELMIEENKPNTKELKKVLKSNICLLSIVGRSEELFELSTIKELLERNAKIQTTLLKRIFKCKNAHLSLLDYKIIQSVNVAVIFENVWKLHQTQQTGKSYEECLREYWELISLNTFSKYFLFILGVCKLNQIPPSRSHLLGIPKEILHYIGSFLNPKDFSIDLKESNKILTTENQELKKQSIQSQTEIQELKKQLAELQTENQELKEQLASKRKKKSVKESKNQNDQNSRKKRKK